MKVSNEFPAHDPVGRARDSATCGIDATCAAEPDAHGQEGQNSTPNNT